MCEKVTSSSFEPMTFPLRDFSSKQKVKHTYLLLKDLVLNQNLQLTSDFLPSS